MTVDLADAIAAAAACIGEHEDPPGSNRNRFAAELNRTWPLGFSRQGAPWCGNFVDWVFDTVGARDLLPSSTYTVANSARAFEKASRLLPAGLARPGDLMFRYDTARRRWAHVGLLVAWDEFGRPVTIEGNTSSGDAGSQTNGGQVAERRRPLEWWRSAGRIDWPTTTPPTPEDDDVPDFLLRLAHTDEVFAMFNSGKVRHIGGGERDALVARGVPFEDGTREGTAGELDRLKGYAAF